MCSGGGPMGQIDMKKLKTKKYRCLDCGNEFKGIGKHVVCPSCQSDNVEALE
jgi:rubrerythrin